MVKIDTMNEMERMRKELENARKGIGVHHNPVEILKMDYVNIGGLQLNFQRTCRVPPGQVNSLPAGLGNFPVYKVSDFRAGCPKEWQDGGFFLPMYRQEAMWINFARGYAENPKALIIGAGNINAISAKPFDPSEEKGWGKKKRSGKSSWRFRKTNGKSGHRRKNRYSIK